MDQDEGYFREVVEANLRPDNTKALAQGTPLRSRISCTRHEDLSRHDPIFEGIPPHHQDAERWARLGRVEAMR